VSFIIELFDPQKNYTDYKKFHCGHSVIDRFVRSSLRNQIKQGFSVGYALLDTSQNDRFAGFFTIANHSIPMNQLTALNLSSLPRVIPCVRLIMLGVNKKDSKAGLGKRLINLAFDLAKISSQSIGCFGMYLDADPQSIHFYTNLGFALLEGNKTPHPSPMFIPISAIS
jgi:GNAT superfamily N-acetyltransferase